MPGVGISDFGASFIYYLPSYVKTFNTNSVIRNIPLGKVKWEGEKGVKKVQVSRNTAITSGVDGGAIPPAGKMTYVESEFYRKFKYGSINLTDGVMENAKTTKNAAISVMDSEMRGLMDGIKSYEEFMFSRDGTGVVALLGATASGATFTVDDARGLWDGQDYEIRSQTTPFPILNSFVVSSIARARTAGESTVTPSVALGALGQIQNDLIVWKSGAYSAWGRAITGLEALIDDTAVTFQGVNVATYPRYSSVVMNGGGATQNQTPQLFRQMLAALAQEQGEDSVGNLLVYTSVWDSKNFEEMYEGELRIAPDTKVGGIAIPTFQSSFGKFSVLTAPMCQYGEMFFIDRTQISHPTQKELDWRPGGTAGIFNRSDSFAGYTATAIEISDLFIEDRRTSGKLQNLAVTVGTAY
jgi:hypothetical protein